MRKEKVYKVEHCKCPEGNKAGKLNRECGLSVIVNRVSQKEKVTLRRGCELLEMQERTSV